MVYFFIRLLKIFDATTESAWCVVRPMDSISWVTPYLLFAFFRRTCRLELYNEPARCNAIILAHDKFHAIFFGTYIVHSHVLFVLSFVVISSADFA